MKSEYVIYERQTWTGRNDFVLEGYVVGYGNTIIRDKGENLLVSSIIIETEKSIRNLPLSALDGTIRISKTEPRF